MKILNVLTRKRKTGNRGERLAVKYLRKNRYKILECNYVALQGEIDIIAESKDALSFIEVKTRTLGHENLREPRPASAVNPKKQQKIIHTAKYYLGTHKTEKRINLDIIEVYLNEDGTKNKIIHMKNAFNINTAYEKRNKTK